MNKLLCWVARFCRTENGPTAVEYAVLLSLIIAVCVGAIALLGRNASSEFTAADSALDSGPGAAPPGVGGGSGS